ncbi:TetR/AcrR family transcriptional regulator [Microbacterium kyungheense]|uniref:TetR family transcriptional regulator n=1 Tax=Microbacterium kyungheense TaxID=1263636 RepID=A0A543F3A1_9MICO|nr:TetR family transcriptional regulator [Microbacterium kyungheense]TQM28260.1 TetR family transcriptional regulator [Microbacterium kyungheense]
MFSEDAAVSTPPLTKSERTRAKLRDIALLSFHERGYDATTIRLIAEEAGVSVGTTHYHFATKNHLVQELYLDVQQKHRDAALPELAASTDLVDRLAIVYRTGLDQLTPFHAHAPEFLSAAVSPRSPINPLSDESAEALGITQELFREAVDGAAGSPLPDDFRAALPRALVLGHLLLALFWVYDRSPGQERTRALLDRGLRLLRLALPLTRMPLLRRPLQELLDLVASVGA